MSDIHPDQYFYLPNGRALKSIHELAEALKAMDDAAFHNHVNDQKNDFANWVRGVFKNEKLANKILSMSSRERTIEAIESETKHHSSFTGPLLKSFPFIKSSAKEIMHKDETKHMEDDHKFYDSSRETKSDSPEKLNEILMKEREIAKREEKILEVEQKMERELAELVAKRNQKFFTAEFVQGFLMGLLAALIIGLVYLKFYM